MALEDGTNDDGEALGTNNDARVAMLNRINDDNDRMRAEEFLDVNDDGTTEQFVVQTDDGQQTPLTDDIAADPETAATIAALAAESDAEPARNPKLHRIKVNGVEQELTYDQLVERAQKVASADQYLAEASRLRAQQQQQQNSQPQVSHQAPAPEEVIDDLAIARAIQMGSEEEAVAALRKLRSKSPSVTPDDISRTIDERLAFNEAIQKYRTEYADIVNDPVLNQMALETDKKLLAAGDKRPYFERYADIGSTLRNWTNELVQKRAPAPVPQGVEKLARKAAATPVPKAASQKTESAVEEEADESTASVIANIAKSRGGPQWMNSMTRH